MGLGKDVVTRILILADGSQARREFDTTTKAGRQAERDFTASSKRLGHAANTASNVVLGAGVLIAGYSVKAAMAAETGQTQIRNALKKTNLSVGEQADMYKKMTTAAEEASTHGGGTAPQEMSGLAKFTYLTNSATQATKDNAAANALAKSGVTDYGTAVNAVAGAEAGRFRGIAKYTGILPAVTTNVQALTDAHKLNIYQIDRQAKLMGKSGAAWKAQQLLNAGVSKEDMANAQVLDKKATSQAYVTALTKKYSGAQEDAKHKLADSKHAIENAAASIGKSLIPLVKTLATDLKDAVLWMAKHKTLVEVLGGALLGLAGAYKALRAALAVKKLFSDLNTVFSHMPAKAAAAGAASEAAGGEAAAGATLATSAWRTFMMTTIIGLVVVGLVLMVTHWKQVKRIAVEVAKAVGSAMSAAFKWIKHAAEDVWRWIRKNFPYLLGALAGPFGLAAVWILKHMDKVKGIVKDVLKFIKGIGKDILNALVWPFKQAYKFAKGLPLVGGLFSGGGAVHKAAGGPIYAAGGYGPRGTDTVPAWLSPGEGVINRSGMRSIGESGLSAINNGRGSGQQINIAPAPVTIKLDSRVIAQGVLRYTLGRAARGSSSLVGGALATHGGYSEFATGAP